MSKQITIIIEGKEITTTINWLKGDSPQREIEAIENRIGQTIQHWWFE